MTKIKLLIVDDHKIIRDGVKLMLGNTNEFTIVGEADSASAALNFLGNSNVPIDVMLIDINMPDINGIELTKKVLAKYPTINILALTMHAEDNYIQNMLKAGALGYILKESGQEELIIAVKAVAEGKKYFSNEVSVRMIESLISKEKKIAIDGLSEREMEVLKLIAMGKTNKEAGEILFVSPRTIETHRRGVMEKLDLHNISELIQYAIKHNIIDF